MGKHYSKAEDCIIERLAYYKPVKGSVIAQAHYSKPVLVHKSELKQDHHGHHQAVMSSDEPRP